MVLTVLHPIPKAKRSVLPVIFLLFCSFASAADVCREEEPECTRSENFLDRFGLFFQEENENNGDPFETISQKEEKRQHDNAFSQFTKFFSEVFDGKNSNQQQKGDGPSSAERKYDSKLTSLLLETTQRRKNSLTRDMIQIFQLFMDNLQRVMDQVTAHFQPHLDIPGHEWNPLLAFWYRMERTEELHTYSWKRRKHWFDTPLTSIRTMTTLHSALYLSQLAYVSSTAEIEKGLKSFKNNTYQLLLAETQGLPGEPAHFIAVQKGKTRKKPTRNLLQNLFSHRTPKHLQHQQVDSHVLEAILVVRGTKELGDALSDGLLGAADFLHGKAHEGVATAGRHLVEKHDKLFQELYCASKTKIRLSLVGHSLGAGAAAIATMTWNSKSPEWLDGNATAIGFGCPALVTWELSEQQQDTITTVISDDDMVPRLSAASFVNMVLDAMSYDWTDKALEDLTLVLKQLKIPNQLKLLQWANEMFDRWDRPYFSQVNNERVEPFLFPPGICVHMFRDGATSVAGSYTNCSFFRSIETTRTMVDDHLIAPGYHRIMLDWMRQRTNNLSFDFEHNLLALPP